MSKRALITGITGQDGSYLAEHLLSQGYDVWGLIRGQANPHKSRISRLVSAVSFVEGDLIDQTSLVAAVEKVQPDEFYNLGAISFVPLSWQQPELVTEVNGMGVLRCLEAIRIVSGLNGSTHGDRAGIRFYQASSSEMFGKIAETPQHETTIFHPRSPYGVAKAYGHFITKNYRESFGLYAVSGMLFNHESPRRGAEFVTRKISLAVAQIKTGAQQELLLGNLDAVRDWGFAGDYVRAMHLMLQQDEPGDYVIGTGQMYSVRDAVQIAFDHVGLDWHDYVRVDPELVRPAEVETLCADSRRAQARLGWQPKVAFPELMRLMVDADLFHATRQRDFARFLEQTPHPLTQLDPELAAVW
ncbi:MAG: GDPmannose 4,6-dehydratase [Actinoplanes sp.]|jgi:GDPmannose 4,6-dehydratase|nr:GDPmannose 4,6-dehydratase [Actinoplanes sp.]